MGHKTHVSVSDGVEAPSISERAYIVYERQRTQQSGTERPATATKRVASVLMPQLNHHLISLDRTAVVGERNWACLGVWQPRYHDSESRTTKFYGVQDYMGGCSNQKWLCMWAVASKIVWSAVSRDHGQWIYSRMNTDM